MHLSERSSYMANSKHLNHFSNEKQQAILIDRSPNRREEASGSLIIMHNMSHDKTRVSLQLEAKHSNTENVDNPTLDYLMNGDDDDLGAGLIDSVVLPRKTTISSNEKIINKNNSSRIGHEEKHPDDNKEIFVHATTEDQPVFENQTSVQDIVEEIKLLKNKNTITSQTMLDLSYPSQKNNNFK